MIAHHSLVLRETRLCKFHSTSWMMIYRYIWKKRVKWTNDLWRMGMKIYCCVYYQDMMTDEISPCAPCTAVAVYSVVLWLWSHVACSVYTSATGSTLKRFGHSAKQAATCQCQLPWLYALHKAGRVERQRSSSTVCNRTLNSQYSHGARRTGHGGPLYLVFSITLWGDSLYFI